jgi:hypothetical protein
MVVRLRRRKVHCLKDKSDNGVVVHAMLMPCGRHGLNGGDDIEEELI